MSSSSMFTCAGRLATQTSVSATSSAVGGVDQNVQLRASAGRLRVPAGLLLRPFDKTIDAFGLAHVQSVEQGRGRTGLARRRRDRFQAVQPPRAEQEPGALRAKRARR